MRYFTQPQQKYAGTGENCNIAINVIFYPGIQNVKKILVHLIWVCKHAAIKFESRKQFRKCVKNCPKIRGFTRFLDAIAKKDSDWNIAIFTSTSIFLLWLGEITQMLYRNLGSEMTPPFIGEPQNPKPYGRYG